MAQTRSARASGSGSGFLARIGGIRDVALAMGMVSFLLIMIIPLPPVMMDMLIAVSVSISLLVLLTTCLLYTSPSPRD